MRPGLEAEDTAVRVGLFGGTFDPPHYGHLRLAERAREQFGLAEVMFLPNRLPPHKTAHEVSGAEHRYVMTQLACAEHPCFRVSRAEIERPGVSYTVDTLRDFQAAHPQAELYFLTGADAVLEIATWHEPDEVLSRARLVVAPRRGFEVGRVAETLGAERASQLAFLAMEELEISSHHIRELVRAGRSAGYLLPPVVARYAQKQGLYRGR